MEVSSFNLRAIADEMDIACGLHWNNQEQCWATGDNLGNIIMLQSNNILTATTAEDAEECLESTSVLDSNVSAVAFNPKRSQFAFASETMVGLNCYPDMKETIQNPFYRATVPIGQLQFDLEGNFLFVSSHEADVKIFSVQTLPQNDTAAVASTGDHGVRCFALDHSGTYLATVDMRGYVLIHSITYEKDFVSGLMKILEVTQIGYHSKIVEGPALTDMNFMGCQLSWHPNPTAIGYDAIVAVPSGKCCTIFYKKTNDDEWQDSFLLRNAKGEEFTSNAVLNIVEFSPTGAFLLTADVEGKVLVWSFDSKEPTSSYPLRQLTMVPSVEMTQSQFTQNPSDGSQSFISVLWGRASDDNYIVGTTATQWGVWKNVLNADELQQSSEVAASNKVKSLTELADIDAGVDLADFDVDAVIAQSKTSEVADGTSVINETATDPTSIVTSEEKPIDASVENSTSVKRLKKVVAFQDEAQEQKGDEDDDIAFDNVEDNATNVASAESQLNIENVAEIKAASAAPPVGQGDQMIMDEEEYDEEDDGFIDNDVEVMKGNPDLQKMLRYATGSLSSTSMIEQQKSFQPSSTSFDEKGRRYMVWNSVGVIIQREEAIENRIEIRFSNTAGTNKNETFADRSGFVMAALAYEGALFATEAEEEEEVRREYKKERKGSTIYYHAFPGQRQLDGVNESFRWTFTEGEAAVAVAVGKGWAAVATSFNMLYVYSSTGVPAFVTGLAGPVVSMTGHDSHLGVVYHASTAQTNALVADLISIDWRQGCKCRVLTSALPLPQRISESNESSSNENDLSAIGAASAAAAAASAGANVCGLKGAQVEWMGFDVDHHVLTLLDKAGMLWTLLEVGRWCWVPLLNVSKLRKTADHRCWPVMVKLNKFVYVMLNGESRPAIHPQPVVTTKSFRMPVPFHRDGKEVVESHKERLHSILFDQLYLEHISCQHERTSALVTAATSTVADGSLQPASGAAGNGYSEDDIRALEEEAELLQWEADKTIVKSLQDACQNQRIPLALSYALRLHTEKAIEAAITIANHFGRATVAEALDRLLDRKREIKEQAQQAAFYTATPAMSVIADDNYEKPGQNNDSFPDLNDESGEINIMQSDQIENDTGNVRPNRLRKNVPTSSAYYDDGDEDGFLEDEDAYEFKKSNVTLSSKASAHQLKKIRVRSNLPAAVKSRIVSPAVNTTTTSADDDDLDQDSNKKGRSVEKKLNPFAVVKTGHTPLKRKSVYDGIQNLKNSPSPKKPALNRQSSISQAGREHRLSGKRIL